MPLFYVNPSKKGRKGKRVRGRARVRMSKLQQKYFGKRKHRRSKGKKNPGRRARRHPTRSKKMARRKKRKGGRRKGRRSKKHKRKHGRKGRRGKRRKGGRKGRRKGRKGKRKGGRRKGRRGKKRRKGTRRHRRSSRRRSRRSKRRRARRGKRYSKRTSVRRRRHAIARAMRVYSPYGPTGTIRMNPRRRRRKGSRRRGRRRGRLAKRYSRRYRRNPGLPGGGAVAMVIGLAKRALPVVAGWVGVRIVINKLGPRIPLVDRLGVFQAPVLAALAPLGYHYVSKKVSILNKYKSEVMLGMGINLVQTLISSFAPASVKAMLGMGGMYDALGMGEYVGLSDYLMTGATPIDDDIALSDYVTVGAEEELGSDGLHQELGLEQELGADIGGVSQNSLLAPIPTRSFVGAIPTRSFVKQIPAAGAGYDNAGSLYTGIFGGGL